jgi:hypothetical protein
MEVRLWIVVVTFLDVFTLWVKGWMDGCMDGWMDEKELVFFGFGLVCLTLLKLIMDEKEIDLSFLSCFVPLDGKGLDFFV